jgi:hypothetical protein
LDREKSIDITLISKIAERRFRLLEKLIVIDGRLVHSPIHVRFSLLVFVSSMDRPELARVWQTTPVFTLTLISTDDPGEVVGVNDTFHLHILVELFDKFRGLCDERGIGIASYVQEEEAFESEGVGVENLADGLEDCLNIDGHFLGLKVDQNVPFLNHASHQHELLQRGQQTRHRVEVVALLELPQIAPGRPDDDDWGVVVVPAVGVEVAEFENIPSQLVQVGHQLVLVPFVIGLDAFDHLREVKGRCVVEAEEQFVGVVDVGRLFLEVFLQFVDGLSFEGLVKRTSEDATHLPTVQRLEDVGG